MANQLKFSHGAPLMVDYTPSSAVVSGQVVVLGGRPLVCHTAIPADKLGALATGGGVYICVADAGIAANIIVYWDAATDKVTETVGANKIFGIVTPNSSSGSDGDPIIVEHVPV